MSNFEDMEPGRDGLYAIVLKTSQDKEEDDYYYDIFNAFGVVKNIRQINDLTFIRYEQKSEAIECLKKAPREYRARIAHNKPKGQSTDHQNNKIPLESKNSMPKWKNDSHRNSGSNFKLRNVRHSTPMSSLKYSSDSSSNTESSSEMTLGKRIDKNTHLFIANLPDSISFSEISELLKNYHVISISNAFTTVPPKPVEVKYAIVTMPMEEAISAMNNLNMTNFKGKHIMVMEVQAMYEQVTSPLEPGEDRSLIPLSLKQLQLQLSSRNGKNSPYSSS